MKLPSKMWVITCDWCDNKKIKENWEPHTLIYYDLDWACTDAKERNKDHAGHKVVQVQLRRVPS